MARIKDIIGYKKEVKKLESICDFLKNTEKYIGFGTDLPNCLLICGASGVGKTFMAEALIEDSGREVFNFEGDGGDVGQLKRIFKKAKKSADSIVFIDDADYLTGDNDCPVYYRLTEELENCEGCEVFIILTAYSKERLPEYLVDKFDSDMIIKLDPPKIEEACEIFKPIFDEEKIEKDFNINDFCCFAQNCTYSFVKETFNNASRLAVYEGCERISMRHLIKAGLLIQDSELAEEFDEATAYHEAGHAAVNLLLGGDAACIVLFADNTGYFKEKNLNIKTHNDMERKYLVSVAGKACEEIFTGTSSIGSSSDLEKVSEAIETDLRALASQGFEYFNSCQLNSPAYNDMLAKKVQSDIQKYYDRAKELIVQNRPLIEAFAEKLKNKYYLLNSEIQKIYDEYKERVTPDLKAG